MPPRISAENVKAIISTSLEGSDLDPFLNAANLLVDYHLASSGEFNESHLAEIERWLAAHLLASSVELQVSSETVGGVSVSYTVPSGGLRLNSTTYGQQVLLLDVSGKLASLGKGKVSIHAIRSFDD